VFIERTRTALGELMGRRLDDVRVAVMMLDGLEIAGRTHIVALGISTEGVKIPLGLWEGSTENATLARTLLADLVDRGLDPEQAILFVIDGGKAIRRAIKDVFGEHALVQRCHVHYAEVGVMPRWVAEACGGGRIGLVGVRIIWRGRGGCVLHFRKESTDEGSIAGAVVGAAAGVRAGVRGRAGAAGVFAAGHELGAVQRQRSEALGLRGQALTPMLRPPMI